MSLDSTGNMPYFNMAVGLLFLFLISAVLLSLIYLSLVSVFRVL